MKRLLALMSALAMPALMWAQDTERGLDDRINDAIAPVSSAVFNFVFTAIPVPGTELSVPIVLIVLLGGATFFTIYFG
ncbi:MAG: alanine glycine permease, partial [Bacteroidia bacterium]